MGNSLPGRVDDNDDEGGEDEEEEGEEEGWGGEGCEGGGEEEEGGEPDEEVEAEEGEDEEVEGYALPSCPVERVPDHIRERVKKQEAKAAKPATIDFSKFAAAKAKSKAKSQPKPGQKATSAAAAAAAAAAAIAPSTDDGKEKKDRKEEADDTWPPKGKEGAIWEALRPTLVREARDARSAKCGALQEGETCIQIGAWKVESSGSIRMPVRIPKTKVIGWVALDDRRCKNAAGGYGELGFELRNDETPAPVEEDASQPASKSAAKSAAKSAPARDEIDELFEIFGEKKPKEKDREREREREKLKAEKSLAQQRKNPPLKAANTDEALEAAGRDRDAGDGKWVVAERSKWTMARGETAAKTNPKATAKAKTKPGALAGKQAGAPEQAVATSSTNLSENEKRLRNVQKKLREVEVLEARAAGLPGGLDDLMPEQREKVNRAWLLRQEERAAREAVRDEQDASKVSMAASGASKKKRKKNKSGSGTDPAGTDSADLLARGTSNFSVRSVVLAFALLMPLLALLMASLRAS